jgi:hypothetical protein
MSEPSWHIKLNRAFEIRDEFRDYLAEQGSQSRQVRYENNAREVSNPRVWAQWVAESTPAYERAAVLLGDAIHNMRAAMDHAIWSITPEQVRRDHPRRVEFPLHSTERAFKKWLNDRKRWYGPTVVEVLEWAQPFTAPTTQIHPLHLLQYLSNTDKHRLLNVVAHNQVNLAEITVVPEPEGGVVSTVNEGIVEAGTVLGRVEFQRPVTSRADEKLSVDIQGFFAYEQVVRYIDINDQQRWQLVGEAMNAIGPMVVQAVGYLLSADRKDKGLDSGPPDADPPGSSAEHDLHGSTATPISED